MFSKSGNFFLSFKEMLSQTQSSKAQKILFNTLNVVISVHQTLIYFV